MSKLIDLTGKQFGSLKVLKRVSDPTKRQTMWMCRCDCGSTIITQGVSLRCGRTKSCGCLHREQSSDWMKELLRKRLQLGEPSPRTTHSGSSTRLYHVWQGMKCRCYNPKHKYYKNYGGRDIYICDEWKDDFAAFRDWALKAGYDETAPRGTCTIDRIDVNGPYAPWNCRWVTMAEQNRNHRPRIK